MASNSDKSPFLTTGERVRNYLGWAFVISLAVHILFGPFLAIKQARTEDQQTEKVSVTKKIKVKVPTPPPPTPTPKPTEQPKQTPPPKKQVTVPQPKLKIQPPKTSSQGSGPSQAKYVAPKTGSENGVPQGQGTPPAQQTASTPGPPASTPKPACAVPYKEATATSLVSPEYPESAREANLGPVVVLVRITLSPGASVISAGVAQSSGNSSIDQAAQLAARQSSYSPKVVDCNPVEGTYIFRANFDPSG